MSPVGSHRCRISPVRSEAAIRVYLRPGAYPRHLSVLGLTTYLKGRKNSPRLTPNAARASTVTPFLPRSSLPN